MEIRPTLPPTTTATGAGKKDISPIAFVGIGCGGLIMVGIILLVGGWIWGTKKAKELGLDFEKNPERAVAEMVVNISPDLEKISSDEKAGTMTIRTKDGKETTLSYKDISEGKFNLPGEIPLPAEVEEQVPAEE